MTTASILQQGTIHCFPAGLQDERGRLVNAEISAVAYDGSRLLMASDKPIPGETRSAVFALPLTEDGPDDTRSVLEFARARGYGPAATPSGPVSAGSVAGPAPRS